MKSASTKLKISILALAVAVVLLVQVCFAWLVVGSQTGSDNFDIVVDSGTITSVTSTFYAVKAMSVIKKDVEGWEIEGRTYTVERAGLAFDLPTYDPEGIMASEYLPYVMIKIDLAVAKNSTIDVIALATQDFSASNDFNYLSNCVEMGVTNVFEVSTDPNSDYEVFVPDKISSRFVDIVQGNPVKNNAVNVGKIQADTGMITTVFLLIEYSKELIAYINDSAGIISDTVTSYDNDLSFRISEAKS